MKLSLLSTSDVHGYIMPTQYGSRYQDAAFGLAKVASVIKEEKLKNTTLCVETGDFIQGSPLSYYIAKNDQHEVSELMAVANKIGYDVGIVGNHEFNYGFDYLKKAVAAADYPIISANIIDKKTEKPVFEPYQIFEKDGVKIGVIGVTTQYIPHWENPHHIEGLAFESIIPVVKSYVEQLRPNVDVLVVAYHGGFERDLETGESTEALTGENEGYALLQEVEGIDALITGHQHRRIATKVNGVPVVQPGFRGQFIGKISLELEEKDGRYHIIDSEASLIDMDDVTVDDEVVATIHNVNEEVENWLDQPLAHVVKGSMIIDDPHAARLSEHPYIEFIQKVQMEATGADISGTALFNNEGKGFNDTITMRDIVTNYIYPNTLAVERLTGKELKAAMEQSLAFFTINENGELTITPRFVEPKPQYYNYDMYEGIDYIADLTKPEGERLVSVTYHGHELADDEVIEVVMNQYRAVGGGNFAMFSADKIVKEVQIDMTELIADYLMRHKEIEATSNHNFELRY